MPLFGCDTVRSLPAGKRSWEQKKKTREVKKLPTTSAALYICSSWKFHLQYFSLSRRGQTAGIKERHCRTYPICELSRLDDILKKGEGNAFRWHLGNITSFAIYGCSTCLRAVTCEMRANKTDLDHSALHDQGDVGVEEGGLVESETWRERGSV